VLGSNLGLLPYFAKLQQNSAIPVRNHTNLENNKIKKSIPKKGVPSRSFVKRRKFVCPAEKAKNCSSKNFNISFIPFYY